MWTIYKINVLKSLITFQYSNDTEGFAYFIAKEYDKCIKRGGDMIYGVPVMNGNVNGMARVITQALKKGQESGGENFNILAEIYPSAFDEYWLGAEMSPIPNPLLRPLGWPSTPPAPGTIMNIGPNPIRLAATAAVNKALKQVAKQLVDDLKSQIIVIEGIGEINLYDTILKIIKRQPIDSKIKNHPLVQAGKIIVLNYEEIKKKKPSIGAQIKKALKFPFPELPKRQKIIDAAKNKLIDEAIKVLEESIVKPIEEAILTPIYTVIQSAVDMANNLPKKPTKEEIKKFVKDTIDGVIPDIVLPGISIPHIPTKAELKEMIKEKIPTKPELEAMAYDMIKGLIPNIPNIWFIPPTLIFSEQTIIFLNPFVNLAKFHLMGVSGTMMVMAQYPPPAPPAPAILNWTGYKVIG